MRFLILILSVITLSFAVLAYVDEVNIKQNDGTTFKAKLKGDEWFNWIEDKAGNVILYNKDSKSYEYAKVIKIGEKVKLVPSGIKVSPEVSEGNKTLPAIPYVDKTTLSKIWKEKREEALKYTNTK